MKQLCIGCGQEWENDSMHGGGTHVCIGPQANAATTFGPAIIVAKAGEGWTPELLAAHKARLEFMAAMSQSHYSRTDAEWHVQTFRKTVEGELSRTLDHVQQENAKLEALLQRNEGRVKNIVDDALAEKVRLLELQIRDLKAALHKIACAECSIHDENCEIGAGTSYCACDARAAGDQVANYPCPVLGAEKRVDDRPSTCVHCGISVPMNVPCPKCGLGGEKRKCAKCGKAMLNDGGPCYICAAGDVDRP